LVAPVLNAGGASASPIFVGWSSLLPAWVYTYNPSSADDCVSGKYTCVDKTIRMMANDLSPLATACQHSAVFSLAYLRTTEMYKRVATEPGFLQEPSFVNHEDAVFAQFYFDAYDRWTAGDYEDVPPAWQIAFDAARDKRVTGSGDLLLGMNAHVNRDLPIALAAIGIVRPARTSRKADHDAINEMLNRVVSPLLAEVAQRFDPSVDDVNTPYGLSYTVLMQTLILWRETAWRNAERLATATTDAERQSVVQSIEDYAATVRERSRLPTPTRRP